MIIGISGYSGSGKDTVGQIIQLSQCSSPCDTTVEEVINNYKMNEWWLEDSSGWEIKKWAGKLKTIASLLTGIPQEKFEDQEFKKTYLGPEWDTYGIIRGDGSRQVAIQAIPHDPNGPWLKSGDNKQVQNRMTVRDFLQKLGTDGLRDGLHENTWVNALMADYKPTQIQWAQGPIGGYKDGPMPNWIITDTRFPNEAQAIKDAGGIVIRVDRPGVKPVNPHPSETGLDNWNFDYRITNSSDLETLMSTVHEILAEENLISKQPHEPEELRYNP